MAGRIRLSNLGQIEGRLTRDITVFDNKDGSKKVMINIADNFKTAKGERKSQYISLQAFLPNGVELSKSVYNYMHKGDLVRFAFELRANNYEKDGEMVYEQVAHIVEVELKETKKAQAARENGVDDVATMPEEFANQEPAL